MVDGWSIPVRTPARKPSDSFRLSLLIMAVAGFFPLDVRTSGRAGRRAHLVYSTIMIGVFILGLVAQLTYFAVNWRDVDSTISTVPVVVLEMLCVLKIYIFWKNNARITGLLDQMDGDSWVWIHPAPQALVYTIPVGTALLAAMPVIESIQWLLFPFFGASGYFKFPIKTWIPDYFTNTAGYYTLLCCEVMVISIAGAAETVTNTIICGLMAHVRAQLVILRENLQSIGKEKTSANKNRHRLESGHESAAGNSTKNLNLHRTSHGMVDEDGCKMDKEKGGKMQNVFSSLKQHYKHTMDLFVRNGVDVDSTEKGHDNVLRRVGCKELHGEFVKCLRHHQTILNFVKELEDIFTWVVFTQFTTSAIIICSSILQITIVSMKSIEFYYSVILAGGMCTELAIFCFFGDYIMEESLLLPEAIYCCDWLSADVTFRRQMLIFMETAKAPITISAGKFFQLSKQTFLNILKTSYSYYAVFRGLRVNGKFEQ